VDEFSVKNLALHRLKFISIVSIPVVGFIFWAELPYQAKIAGLGGAITISMIVCSLPITESQSYRAINLTLKNIDQYSNRKNVYIIKAYDSSHPNSRQELYLKIGRELEKLKYKNPDKKISLHDSRVVTNILSQNLLISDSQVRIIEEEVDQALIDSGDDPFFNPGFGQR
jgi:hypothetical protein